MKRAALFTGIVYLLTWAALGVAVLLGAGGAALTIVFAAVMFCPALSVLLTRRLTHQGLSSLHLQAHFRSGWRYYLLAYFLPTVLVALGTVVYFVCFPAQFDPTMAVMLDTLRAAGVQNPTRYAVLTMVVGVLTGPIINILLTLGEELGWRGYLQYQLEERFSRRTAAVLTGVIWGVWHAPMIMLGHNYGVDYPGYPVSGILLFTVFCVAFGLFLSWLTWHSGSVYPAAMAHSAFNALAGTPTSFLTPAAMPNPLLGPTAVGVVAMLPVLAAGVFFCVRLGKNSASTAQG